MNPKQVLAFTATFDNIGDPDETLKVISTYPLGVQVVKQFLVGVDCFVEDVAASNSLSLISDEILIAHLSMCAILAGGVLPGTQEFVNALGDQSTTNFQTPVGNVKLKSNPVAVSDLSVGADGTVYDIEFMRVGQSTNTKVVRAAWWDHCQYANREDSPAHAAPVVPGAIWKSLALKKSQLGGSGSANRQAVIDLVAASRFWV